VPIYEYRCSECGHQQEHLQKVSDPVLSTCPACGRETYTKQVTAAGFQLKGSGWYATDFKGGGKKTAVKDDAKAESKTDAKSDAKPDAKSETKSDGKSDTKSDGKSGTKATASAGGDS
jgi:putative FmdB family regulatory protein